MITEFMADKLNGNQHQLIAFMREQKLTSLDQLRICIASSSQKKRKQPSTSYKFDNFTDTMFK
jgi:hypothetical protein